MIRRITDFAAFDAMDSRNSPKPRRWMLWVDGVGGYRVHWADRVTVGQPGGSQPVDVPILGDLSSRHARIGRDGEGYLIEAMQEVRVDGRLVRGVAALEDNCRILLGRSVQLVFRRPHPLSATARLDWASHHRVEPHADGVLLMADTCVLGPSRQSHVVCRNWPGEVLLYRQGDALLCRAAGPLCVDGMEGRGRIRLEGNARVTGEGFSFSIEEF